jgi:hypothetical protein
LKDFEIARKIYNGNPVIELEDSSSIPSYSKPFNIEVKTPFNMSNDSYLFQDKPEVDMVPVYEAKQIHIYNNRFATYENNQYRFATIHELNDSGFISKSQYYISKDKLKDRFGSSKWFFVYRMITNVANARTTISAIIPGYACGNSLSLVTGESLKNSFLLLANFNSFVFDYLTRQKIGGTNYNHWILKQLPVVDYKKISVELLTAIQERSFKLTYTSIDLKLMADELGYKGSSPFNWNEKERFQLQCELDAIYAHLYGLEKEEMDYILETFPIVKRKDIAKYGSYRTKETILQLYDEFAWVSEEMKHQTHQE